MGDSGSSIASNYAEEIQRRIPLRIATASAIPLLLYWGAVYGQYNSALVGVLNLSVTWAIEHRQEILRTPFYVYIAAFTSAIASLAFAELFTRVYFRYVTSLPSLATRLDQLFRAPVTPDFSDASTAALLDELEYARRRTRRWADSAHICFVFAVSMLVIGAAFGNALDILIGAGVLLVSAFLGHKACRVYLADLVPRRAALTRIYSGQTRRVSPRSVRRR